MSVDFDKHHLLSGKYLLAVIMWVAMLLSPLPPSLPAAEKVNGIDFSTAFIQAAKKNIPAVVHIEVTERQEAVHPFQPPGYDPFMQRFFNAPDKPGKFKKEVKGLGTGMIIDAQGHILTNHHVAGGAKKLEVLLSNGTRYPAKLIGTDPKTDLAVIKIEAKEALPHVTFGDSDKVEVGEWVVAIGHPRGLDQTVTQGIISAKHRRGITDPGSYQDFLQTDAAINPGNSGGPLLNLQGEVIGVNAAIVSQSGGSEGIGFTIPSNMAVNVARALIEKGKVERGWIGVSIQEMTPELAAALNLAYVKGALIVDLIKGGPAEKAGLKKNDLVIAYQDKEVSDSNVVRNEVAATAIGREVKLTVLRDGKKQFFFVKIENIEAFTRIMATNLKTVLGIEIRALTPDEIGRFRLNSNQGVAVSWLDEKGPLAEVGFEEGDIILRLENQPIEGPEAFLNLMSSLKSKGGITLLAIDHRTGNVGNVQVTVK